MIRNWLNEDNIPSARGGLWNVSSVREICLRALEGTYSGTAFWNRTGKGLRGTGQKWKNPDEWVVVEDAHPAIITNDECEELRQVKGPEIKKRKGRGGGSNIPKALNSRWLLSGQNALGEPFFRCLNGDDHNMVGNTTNQYDFYICNKYKNYGPTGCNKPMWIPKSFELDVIKIITQRFTENKIM